LDRLRQLEQREVLTYLRSMDPSAFEELTAALFAERGFAATLTRAAGDEGVDVFLRRSGESAVVQCKRYEGSVGQPTVRDLYGTMMHHGADAAYLVTSGSITSQARDWAFGKPIHLIDGYALASWIVASAASDAAGEPARSGRNWLWPAGIALSLLFVVMVVVAFTRITGRLRPDIVPPPTNPPATVAAVAVTATADGAAVPGTPSADADAAETTTAQITPVTPTPLPPTATPTPCPVAVDAQLADLHTRDALGCASGGAQVIWAAWEPFERGYMLWRSDTDAAYAFYDSGQRTWLQVDVSWDGSAPPDRGEPPPGLQKPERGFGYAWSVRDDLFQNLGWATDREKGFCALVQPFDQGYLLKSVPVPSCTPDNLYNEATAGDWAPVTLAVHESGMWDSTALSTGGATATGSPTAGEPGATTQTRPPEHGLFRAAPAGVIVLDGEPSEWSGTWQPVSTLVQGGHQHAGAADLSGDFQVQWSNAGLYLAVRVQDEQHSSGPDGTNMWQGDGLEIHLDRELAADFADTQADADDYQLGISFGPELNALRGYRWLPYAREGAFGMDGGVRHTTQGYSVEVLLPWFLFEIDGDALRADTAFGFNVSINDNDGPVPAQQSVLSASPARTTFDDPTEWGTLVLAP
jgi:hypothetical protein